MGSLGIHKRPQRAGEKRRPKEIWIAWVSLREQREMRSRAKREGRVARSEDVNSKGLQRRGGEHSSKENCDKGKGRALERLGGMQWERGKSREANSNSSLSREEKSRKWSPCFVWDWQLYFELKTTTYESRDGKMSLWALKWRNRWKQWKPRV